MASIWLTVLGLFNGVSALFNKVLDYFKTRSLVDQGRVIEKAERSIKEAANERAANEVIVEDRSREQTIKRMEDGSF